MGDVGMRLVPGLDWLVKLTSETSRRPGAEPKKSRTRLPLFGSDPTSSHQLKNYIILQNLAKNQATRRVAFMSRSSVHFNAKNCPRSSGVLLTMQALWLHTCVAF